MEMRSARTVPERSSAKPSAAASVVVLPAPLRPMIPIRSPRLTEIETSSSTVVPPYPAETFTSVSSPNGMPATPEIDLAHLLIVGNLLGCAGDENGTRDQHNDVLCKTKHEIHVMLDEQDREV